MKDTIAKITKWVLYILIGVATVAGLLFYANILSTELFLNIGKLIVILGLIIMVLSSIYGLVTNPKNIKVMIISLAVGAIVLAVSYMLAGNDYSALQLEQMKITEQTSKFVGMGLIALFIMFGLAILAFLYSAISKVLK
ncbi:MAG TPA: hypothetical protein VIN10_02745 [Bacteroidales bacterium]